MESKEREVGYEAGDGVGRGAVGVEGGLAYEDEALLDEGWDGVVRREEEDAGGEDEEAEAVGDALEVLWRVGEHGGHHQSHEREDEEAREE